MFFAQSIPISPEPPCPGCGVSLTVVARTGRVGCAHCYEHFTRALSPYIRRIHGPTVHTGAIPGSAGPELRKKRRAAELKTELQRAIEAQDFERCAVLRDEIRELEGSHV